MPESPEATKAAERLNRGALQPGVCFKRCHSYFRLPVAAARLEEQRQQLANSAEAAADDYELTGNAQKKRPPACMPGCCGNQPFTSQKEQLEQSPGNWHRIASPSGIWLQNGLRTPHQPTYVRHPAAGQHLTVVTCSVEARLVKPAWVSGKVVMMELEDCASGRRQVYAFQLAICGEVLAPLEWNAAC